MALPKPLLPRAVVAINGPGALAEFIGKDVEICDNPVILPFMGGMPKHVPQRKRDASPQDDLPLHVYQCLAQAAFVELMQPYIDRARLDKRTPLTSTPDVASEEMNSSERLGRR